MCGLPTQIDSKIPWYICMSLFCVATHHTNEFLAWSVKNNIYIILPFLDFLLWQNSVHSINCYFDTSSDNVYFTNLGSQCVCIYSQDYILNREHTHRWHHLGDILVTPLRWHLQLDRWHYTSNTPLCSSW